ncbi:MAG: 50S ribosomal protein L15 [bacterium]
MLSLSSLKPKQGSTKNRKRVGRGNASGHGTYATRGLKGQNSRSGVSGLKRLGMKPMLLNIPKKRGFTSLAPKAIAVNVFALSKVYKDNEVVSRATLIKKGLIDDSKQPIKILGQGTLTIKGLQFEKVGVSQSAREQIEKLGGKIQ